MLPQGSSNQHSLEGVSCPVTGHWDILKAAKGKQPGVRAVPLQPWVTLSHRAGLGQRPCGEKGWDKDVTFLLPWTSLRKLKLQHILHKPLHPEQCRAALRVHRKVSPQPAAIQPHNPFVSLLKRNITREYFLLYRKHPRSVTQRRKLSKIVNSSLSLWKKILQLILWGSPPPLFIF